MNQEAENSLLDFDLKSINLKIGLEVHQQLATPTKLFCSCPPFNEAGDGESDLSINTPSFTRILRPVSSELGEVDVAAQFESRREVVVNYLAPVTTSCLVEADEEPPHPLSPEALETALIFGLALNSRISDEIHVMRKIVVDGSNTSGFQRTAVVALGGRLKYGAGNEVAVQSISVEEDAARAITSEAKSATRTYALDRLGTPLVEVALAPIEGSPEDAEEAAKTLGKLMRSTGRVARGLGTIRQDLNISVMGGNVIEVKGVQRLDQFRKVISYEAARQKFFFDLAAEIRSSIGEKLEINNFVVTDQFRNTRSKILQKSLSDEPSNVVCIVIRSFAGFIGRENEFHARLGKELGAIAKSYGLGGVFHSDELPNYGITQEEVSILKVKLNLRDNDAFVLVAGKEQRTHNVSEALIARLKRVTGGVPAETRAASIDGETLFLRPRAGSARMYPETDIPLIQVTEHTLNQLKSQIPEPWEKLVKDFSIKYKLPNQLGEPLYDSERKSLFEETLALTGLSPTFVASVLVDTLLALSRAGVQVEVLSDQRMFEMFKALAEGKFAKEAVQEILREMATYPALSFEEILSKKGFGSITREDLEKIIDDVIKSNSAIITSKGIEGARSTLMGKVMQRVRGKVDGKEVSEALASRLASFK